MSIASYPYVAELDSSDDRRHRRKIAVVLNGAMKAKVNCGVEFVLGEGTSTTVTDDRIHNGCLLFFDALNSTADTCLRVGPLFVAEANRGDGVATITHATGQQGAAFRMAIFS